MRKKIKVYDENMNFIREVGRGKQPKSIIAGEDGNIYILDSGSSKIILVADTGNNIVSIYEKNGIFKKNISIDGEKLEEFKQPKSIIAGEDGNIYILDSGSSKIKVFDSNYKFLYLLGSNKVNGNGKKRIEDIWIAGKKIYIADSLRKKIKVYDENMNFIREVGRGSAAEILIKAGLIALVIIVAFILLKKEKHFKGEI